MHVRKVECVQSYVRQYLPKILSEIMICDFSIFFTGCCYNLSHTFMSTCLTLVIGSVVTDNDNCVQTLVCTYVRTYVSCLPSLDEMEIHLRSSHIGPVAIDPRYVFVIVRFCCDG